MKSKIRKCCKQCGKWEVVDACGHVVWRGDSYEEALDHVGYLLAEARAEMT